MQLRRDALHHLRLATKRATLSNVIFRASHLIDNCDGLLITKLSKKEKQDKVEIPALCSRVLIFCVCVCVFKRACRDFLKDKRVGFTLTTDRIPKSSLL